MTAVLVCVAIVAVLAIGAVWLDVEIRRDSDYRGDNDD